MEVFSARDEKKHLYHNFLLFPRIASLTITSYKWQVIKSNCEFTCFFFTHASEFISQFLLRHLFSLYLAVVLSRELFS